MKNDKTALDELFKKTDLREVSKSQRQDKIGGGIIKLVGEEYLVLKARILSARLHHDAANGLTPLPQFEKQFDQNEGFSLEFSSSTITLAVEW